MERRISRMRQQRRSDRVLASLHIRGQRTEILDILVTDQRDGDLGRKLHAGLGASAQGLVDDDAIGEHGGDKGQAVGKLGHAGVVVHADP